MLQAIFLKVIITIQFADVLQVYFAFHHTILRHTVNKIYNIYCSKLFFKEKLAFFFKLQVHGKEYHVYWQFASYSGRNRFIFCCSDTITADVNKAKTNLTTQYCYNLFPHFADPSKAEKCFILLATTSGDAFPQIYSHPLMTYCPFPIVLLMSKRV